MSETRRSVIVSGSREEQNKEDEGTAKNNLKKTFPFGILGGTRSGGGSAEEGNKNNIESCLIELEKLGLKICPVCKVEFDEKKRRPIQEVCGHIYCFSCFLENSFHGTDSCLPCVLSGRKLRKQKPTSIQVSVIIHSNQLIKKRKKSPDTPLNGNFAGTPTTTTTTSIPQPMDANEDKENIDVSNRNSSGIYLEPRSQKLFRCVICRTAFTCEPSYRQHLKAHKDTGSTSSLPCLKCGESFLTRRTLAEHVKKHKQRFVCPYSSCGIIFATVPDLKFHLSIHNPRIFREYVGYGGFECEYCSRKFRRMISLAEHLRRHRVCGKKFPKKRQLNRPPAKGFTCRECFRQKN